MRTRTPPAIGPIWMPQANTCAAVSAGRWWNAVSVPQMWALDALEILDHESGRAPGPVLWDPAGKEPRLYFLVPLDTADTWDLKGTAAFGRATYIVMPGATTIEPPGTHWLVPPDPDEPEGLVDAAALREALLRAAGGALWLMPPGLQGGAEGTVLAPAGQLWDAVSTSVEAGMPVLDRLLADPDDRLFVGPVVGDALRGVMHWLVAPGASADYPEGCALLAGGARVVLPESAGEGVPCATWLHLPTHRVLSGPAWLAAALSPRSHR